MTNLRYEPVQPDDFEALFALRMQALEPSLKRLGRWNPARSRERFAADFAPAGMRHVCRGVERVGFYTLVHEPHALRLVHLFIGAGYRGQGLGGAVLRHLQAGAAQQGQPLVLNALQHSDANRFYQRHGFVKTGETELDVMHRWQPAAPIGTP